MTGVGLQGVLVTVLLMLSWEGTVNINVLLVHTFCLLNFVLIAQLKTSMSAIGNIFSLTLHWKLRTKYSI